MLYNQQKMRSSNLKQKETQHLKNTIIEEDKVLQKISSNQTKPARTQSWADSEENDTAHMFTSNVKP